MQELQMLVVEQEMQMRQTHRNHPDPERAHYGQGSPRDALIDAISVFLLILAIPIGFLILLS